AISTRGDRENGTAFGRAPEHDTPAADRRRHQPPMPDALRVPCSPTPEFLASCRIMAAQAIAARNEDFFPAVVFERHRRIERFPRFFLRLARTHMTPQRLARAGIHREQIRFDAA